MPYRATRRRRGQCASHLASCCRKTSPDRPGMVGPHRPRVNATGAAGGPDGKASPRAPPDGGRRSSPRTGSGRPRAGLRFPRLGRRGSRRPRRRTRRPPPRRCLGVGQRGGRPTGHRPAAGEGPAHLRSSAPWPASRIEPCWRNAPRRGAARYHDLAAVMPISWQALPRSNPPGATTRQARPVARSREDADPMSPPRCAGRIRRARPERQPRAETLYVTSASWSTRPRNTRMTAMPRDRQASRHVAQSRSRWSGWGADQRYRRRSARPARRRKKERRRGPGSGPGRPDSMRRQRRGRPRRGSSGPAGAPPGAAPGPDPPT
jgi:hypothetical protein